MGLDIAFVNPLSYSPEYPSDKDCSQNKYNAEWYDFTESIPLVPRHACLRVIDWLPYSSLCGNCLYPNIRINDSKTVKTFKEWLRGLLAWINENKGKYAYLSKPKYKWQEPFFTPDDKAIMFGDISSLNSEVEPAKYNVGKNNRKPYYLKHIMYWTDKRQPEYVCMETDAILIEQFIDELNEMNIPDDWVLYMH
jgi:hypothetical protein